jgi:uncharacterized SAM-binding protein YcdF (DUF218 family)
VIVRLLLALVLAWALGFALFAVTLPRPADDGATDAIIVVTGGAKRIERGIALLEADKAKRMLISGVDRTVRPVELAAQYDTPVALFDCCIDLGHEAVDTRSNAEETAGWLERRNYRTVRLVTTDWHMPRARFELERALPSDIELRPDAVRSDPGLRVLLVEYNKYLLRRGAVLAGY